MKTGVASWSALAVAALAATTAAQGHSQFPLQYTADVDTAGVETLALRHESPVAKLHRELVQIESITGNEGAVGDFLAAHLRSLNFTVDKQRVGGASSSRFNIHAYSGGHRETRALLTSHIDTVPPFFNYSVRRPAKDSRSASPELWGRGTNDDKSCVAAQVTALHSLLAEGKVRPADAGLLFVVGEEMGGAGMMAANDLGLGWEAVIFGEPTESKLAAGHKGFLLFEIAATGQAVHSGYPWLGRSANDIIVAALGALQHLTTLSEADGGLPRSDKYGETTINIGKIEGGVAANVVAERAMALVAVRIAAGTPATSRKICLDAIERATAHLLEDGKGHLNVTFGGQPYSPVDCDTDIDGFETITVNYGTDVPSLHGKFKRYLYGPGSILVAHSDHEHLTLDELEDSVDGYKKILLTVLER